MKKTRRNTLFVERSDILPQLDQSWAQVRNPYVADNPVTDTLFVGREDILRQLEKELWAPVGTAGLVVLYGPRLMGKTSILHHLGDYFGAGTTVVVYPASRVYINNTKELLFNLALALYDALPRLLQEKLEKPEEERYSFRRFMKQVDHVRFLAF